MSRRRERRPRILFAHNYPMGAARAGWREGRYPMHHLFGTAHLDRIGDVIDLPVHPIRGRARFGDLRQQLRVLLERVRWGSATVCLAGEDSTVSTLLVLRRLRLAPPMVVVTHELPGRVARAGLAGADRVISNSRRLTGELVADVGVDPARVRTAPWGPDLDFPGYESRGSDFVLSVGKTQRDLRTLLRALERLHVPARVYSDDAWVEERADRCPSVDIRPTTPGDAATLSYDYVLDDLQHAAVFAVPLRDPRRPIGITELDDALALGKPIVMTRNPYIDCDIEEVGCGLWIDEGDVDAWVDALGRLMASPELREAMGQRGRRFAERSWNAELFEEQVVEAIRTVLMTS